MSSPSSPITLEVGDIRVSLQPPPGWQIHFSGHGVVLAQRMGSMTDGGQLEGVMAYIFVQQIAADMLTTPDPLNKARSVLLHVTQEHLFDRTVQVSQPVGFNWSEHDAAYYLVNDGNRTVTIVMAVASRQSNDLVAMYVSAPLQESASIRYALPVLLGNMTINGVQMDVSGLDAVSDPLIFPTPLMRLNVGIGR